MMSTEALLKAWWADTPTVDWSVARVLAEIANGAYEDDASAQRSFRALGVDNMEPLRVGPTCVWVLHDRTRDVSIVSFRGTDETEDWRYNFKAQPVETPIGRIHGGFRELYTSLDAQLIEAVRPIASGGLWLTGHSLGGALANLAAHEFESRHAIQVRGIVTFGQPMLFDRRAAEYMENRFGRRLLRVVNDTDAVPRMPPWFAPWGEWLWFRDGLVERSSDAVRVESLANEDGLGVETRQQMERSESPASRIRGPSTMSEAEYEAFRALVTATHAAGNDENKRFRSIRPLEDHRMTAYLAKIQQASEQSCNSVVPPSPR